MKFSKFTIVLIFLAMMSLNLISQTHQRPISQKNGTQAPLSYNVNITLGGDNVLSSLKIQVIGDNLQVHRNIGLSNWEYQYFEWSDHPGRGIHLYIDGQFYYVNSSTDIYVDGYPSGSNLSYFEDSDGIPYDRIDITRIDDYNATVQLTKANVIEATLTIYYPPESDYVNYAWEITNISNSTMNDLRFFQGGDTYSYGDDYGIGYWDGPTNTVGCQKPGNGGIVSVFLQSIETPFQHESSYWGWYSGVESHIMNNALTGDVVLVSHDNAIALEWRKAPLEVGETWEIHTIEKYSDKDITNLMVTAPYNQTIYQGETKYLTFNIKNNSPETVTDIVLSEVIDLPNWTANVVSPSGIFELASLEDIDVTLSIYCPLSEEPGNIAKVTLQASANDQTADDKAYIEVLSIMPSCVLNPVDQDVCSPDEAVTFFVQSDNATAYQWQKNTSVWTNIIDDDVFSGANNDTLHISDATGLVGVEFRCLMANVYGDAWSESAAIIGDNTPPTPDAITLPDIIGQCEVTSIIPPTAYDECEGNIIGFTDAVFPITDTTVVIWSFEDSFGNTSFLVQDVFIQDITAPVPDLSTLPTISGNCSTTVSDVPTATDNCEGQILGTTTDSLFYDVEGLYIITWNYTDNQGNSISQTQNIVVDDDNPVAETKDTAFTIISTSAEIVTITPADIDNGSYDDCGLDSMYLDRTTFSVDDAGENIVNLTVVDYYGNVSTKSAVVTIIIDYTLQIPNFVSPDNDGVNDYWEIKGIEKLDGYTLDIFNKIGEIIYHSEAYDNTWNATFNGQELPDGTYYYVFKADVNSYSGYISVIR
ncbi:MAG: gliding motility-associated C-terminal domain-containing protein [Bacteroidales bacterium]|nr:gliding motility-associated C-terminal domain-containing protein [Bacteroidales bacterium]